MTQKIYVGVNNVAKNVNKIYVGVNNVAKKVKKGYVGVNNKAELFFDSDYIYINYIEATGTQYINSGILPDLTIEIEAKYKMADYSLASNNCVFASVSQNTSNRIQFIHRNNYLLGYGSQFSNNIASLQTNVEHIALLQQGNFYIDDTFLIDLSPNAGTFYNPKEIYILATNNNDSLGNLTNGRIYYLRIKKNNQLVRDFVPVIRRSDNAVGLLDRVTNTFFGNDGTGTFNYG